MMRRGWLASGVVIALATLTLATEKPVLSVYLQSLDQMVANAKDVATALDKSAEAKQVIGIYEAMTGPKGLEGIDTKRPLLAYVLPKPIGPNTPFGSVVLAVPLADEATFLEALAKYNLGASKGDDGIYNLTWPGPFSVYFRIANQCAYFTGLAKDALAPAELLKPEQITTEGPNTILAVTLRVGQLPPQLKQLLVGQVEMGLAEEKRKPDATPTATKFKVALLDFIAAQINDVLNAGDELTLRIGHDANKKELFSEAKLSGKPGSPLAANLAKLGQNSSVLNSLFKDDGFNVGVNVTLPEALRLALADVVEEGLNREIAKETDLVKKALGGKLLAALISNIKVGTFDWGMSMFPAGTGYGLLMGIRVNNGTEMDKIVRGAITQLPADEQAKVKFDTAVLKGANLHQFPPPPNDAKFTQLFGSGPTRVLFKPDLLLLAFGGDGQTWLTTANDAVAKPGLLAGAVVPVGLVSVFDPGANYERNAKIAQQAFAKAPAGADRIYLTLNGGTEGLALRGSLHLAFLKFSMLMDEAKRKEN